MISTCGTTVQQNIYIFFFRHGQKTISFISRKYINNNIIFHFRTNLIKRLVFLTGFYLINFLVYQTYGNYFIRQDFVSYGLPNDVLY